MKIRVVAETKWVGAKEEAVIDTEDMGFTDEEWYNLSECQQTEELLDVAHELIGFSFGYEAI